MEKAQDIAQIRAINQQAFTTDFEARLVDNLRNSDIDFISLVAEQTDGRLLGHICFTPVSLDRQPSLKMVGLAPMAVPAAWQRRGIGSNLIRQGIVECKQKGYQAAVVLGHPSYYPKFGFTRADQFGIQCEFEVPPEVFMLMEFEPGVITPSSGMVHFHPLFNGG